MRGLRANKPAALTRAAFVTKSDLTRDLLSETWRVAMENNSSSGETKSAAAQGEPWCGLLADAAPRDHIVQLYQDEQFLNRAVCRFAAAAIANGEGVILVPTAAHWEAFCPRLDAEGVDIKAAQAQGQLTVVDADELLPRFMGERMPDAPVF